MISEEQLQELSLIGGTVIGPDGQKIGKFGQIFIDERSGQPEWATVRTGLFGLSESFIPLSEATVAGDTLSVPYDKQTVKDAPSIDPEGRLSAQEEQELYHYYSLAWDESDHFASREGVPSEDARAEYSREDVRGPLAARADDSLIQSEQQPPATNERVDTPRTRLRRHVVTEDGAKTVPLTHGEVRSYPEQELSEDGPEISAEEERLKAELRKDQIETEGFSDGRQTR